MDYFKFILFLSVVIFIFEIFWNFVVFPISYLISFILPEKVAFIFIGIIAKYLLLSMCTLTLLNSFKEPTIITITISTAMCFVFVTFYLANSIRNKEKEIARAESNHDFATLSKYNIFQKYQDIEYLFMIYASLGIILFRIFPLIAQNIFTETIFNKIFLIHNIPLVGIIIIVLILGFLNKILFPLYLLLFATIVGVKNKTIK